MRDSGGNPFDTLLRQMLVTNPRRRTISMKPLELTEQEKADLLALLDAFEGEGWMVTAPIQLPEEP